MKKHIIKLSLFVVLGALVLNSCERELDQISSSSEENSIAMNRPESFRAAVDGAYSAFKDEGYYKGDKKGGGQIIMADIISDNAVMNMNGRGSNKAASNFEFDADNDQVTSLFIAAYHVISRANFVLKYINNGVLTGAAKKNIEAEARGIRAIAHFDIVRTYCKIPTQSSDANKSIGIGYKEIFNPDNKSGTRDLSVEQVYDKIIADLLFAANNITQNDTDKSRLSKSAIYGILSRVYLYKGDYENTIKYGQLSLGISPSITSIDNFKSVWKTTSSTSFDGVLFQIANSPSEGVTVGFAYNQLLKDGYRSEYVVDYDFFNSYSDKDIRKKVYYTTSDYLGNTYNHITKWASVGGSLGVVPIKYIRSAEVLLNVAEASYRKGKFSIALTLLNELRTQRYEGYTPGNESGTSLLEAILQERRFELAFENDRWYTLKRLGLSVNRSGKGFYANGKGEASARQNLEVGNYKWQWPISNSTIQKSNQKIKQNPGY
ncbi:RagB/SusD family nutrient uptake outer membrane protein [Elizabethkingia argentiflava]|uniref:RagB/SusD family nutrient uptake outer membrane protein n=1 Tax=Elizabethkingia argenteiflava TaxID=2681556 RepID=A0A845Q128_9FLAO|nr:RagB/SusD family nutrient uptake outer membrane protein [Elizabethkingia argenteiflava]NAW52030.1 RagB/SusD family nutrient uptake outer membrane protein [Elizabethkingia argenteiflava]